MQTLSTADEQHSLYSITAAHGGEIAADTAYRAAAPRKTTQTMQGIVTTQKSIIRTSRSQPLPCIAVTQMQPRLPQQRYLLDHSAPCVISNSAAPTAIAACGRALEPCAAAEPVSLATVPPLPEVAEVDCVTGLVATKPLSEVPKYPHGCPRLVCPSDHAPHSSTPQKPESGHGPPPVCTHARTHVGQKNREVSKVCVMAHSNAAFGPRCAVAGGCNEFSKLDRTNGRTFLLH